MTEFTFADVVRGLQAVASWLAEQPVGPLAFSERQVVKLVCDALQREGIEAQKDKRIAIPNWTARDLQVDLVIGRAAAPLALAEFKWSLTKLDQLLWDLVKMANGSERQETPETFLIAGTSTENWAKSVRGCEFLGSVRWDLERELRARPKLWAAHFVATLRVAPKTPPSLWRPTLAHPFRSLGARSALRSASRRFSPSQAHESRSTTSGRQRTDTTHDG